MGPLELNLKNKITLEFQPTHLELENESHSHSVPANSETHFRALIVSEKFRGLNRISRQRLVLQAVSQEMQRGVHAFTMRCLAPDEWSDGQGAQFTSPACHGGSKTQPKTQS